jgi:hypothetical protein
MRLLSISSLALFAGCASTFNPGHFDLQEALRAVVFEDGISSAEAETIACNYFGRFISGCGVIREITETEEAWIATTSVGYCGLPGEPIHIAKRDGRVTCAGSPTIEDPLTIWSEVRPRQAE